MQRSKCGASLLAVVTLAVRAAETGPGTSPAASAGAPPRPWYGLPEMSLTHAFGADRWGDLFTLGTWQNTLDLSADGNVQKTTSPGSPDADFWSRVTSQGLTVRNQGIGIIDPRLLSLDVSARLAFQQAAQNASDVDTSQHGDITDYYFSGTFLAEKAYNGTMLASHVENTTTQSGGGSTSSQLDTQSLTLNWREDSFLRKKEIAPFFSAMLQARDDQLQETTSSAGQRFERDEDRKLVTLDGHNGFESSDLYFRYEDTDLENKRAPAASYRSRYLDLNYSMDFGAMLDQKSETHLNYNEREGSSDVKNLNFDEYLFLEHTDYFSSNYAYNFTETDSDAGDFSSHRLDGGVQYMPFLNLSTNLNVFGTRDELGSGSTESTGVYGNATYNHDLPASGRLVASLGAGTQYSDNQLQASTVPVIDAPYQAPSAFGAGASFTLEHSDVVVDTIVVVDVRGGARLETTLDVDYEVIVEGSRTRIAPLPGSAVIQPDDPLEVSYQYLVDPSLESRTDSWSCYIAGDWEWIAVTYTHDQANQTPISGQTTTLMSDQNRDELKVDLRKNWGQFEARADATGSRYRDTNLKYDELRFNEQVDYRPSYYWQLGLAANQTTTDFIETDRHSETRDYRMTGQWTSRYGWVVDGWASYRTMDDSELLPETLKEARVKIRRRWPQLDLYLQFGVGDRTRGGVETKFADVHLTAVRQF
ncbi:MAG TPA: hypothetical protein VFI92_10750 [Steroidobacteraceae bacterium]|nr:hypothetical protein [Steroidobacteraceae bacterium]